MEEASHSKSTVLMGDFYYSSIFWRDNTAQHNQSRRFLECNQNNFLMQVIREPAKGRCFARPDSHKQGRTHERCEYQRQSCCSDHDMLLFRILQGEREVKSRIQSWTSGEQTLSSSGIHLKESHGVQRWREVSRRLG